MRILKIFLMSVALFASAALGDDQIRWESVDQVLEDLRTDPEVEFREEDGWLVASAEEHYTIWTFTPQGHPAHPAVVERKVYEDGPNVFMGTRIICTTDPLVCDRFAFEVAGRIGDGWVAALPGVRISIAYPEAWTLLRRTPVMLLLRQDGAEDGDSVIASIQLERLPALDGGQELLDFVVAQRAQTLGNDPRVTNPVFDEQLTEWNDQTCVAFDYRYVDTAAILADGTTTSMRFANRGISCPHPDEPTIGVRVSYSARYAGDLDAEAFESAAGELLGGVALTPFESGP